MALTRTPDPNRPTRRKIFLKTGKRGAYRYPLDIFSPPEITALSRIRSGVRISASFQKIPRLVGWLGLAVRVSRGRQMSSKLQLHVCYGNQ